MMHGKAAEVAYDGKLELKKQIADSRGLWEGQGFWTTTDREILFTLRELRMVRLLLQRHFAKFISRLGVKKLLLHKTVRLTVVYILNAIVSASLVMMA